MNICVVRAPLSLASNSFSRFHHYLKQVDVSSENLSLLSNTTFV